MTEEVQALAEVDSAPTTDVTATPEVAESTPEVAEQQTLRAAPTATADQFESTEAYADYWRLRDWLKLLDFEIERGGFGCYLPQLSQEDWMRRLGFMDRLGPKWWPILGAVYFVTAVKRVHGMRLIEPKRQKVRKTASVRLPVAHKHPTPERRSTRT